MARICSGASGAGQFDIHTGGVDHIPIHHTNEIAQTEHATGVRPWVRYFQHGGWLTIGGEKMAKASGPTANRDDVIARGVPPLAYRFFLLGAHYRQQLSFTMEALDESAETYRRLLHHAAELNAVGGEPDRAALVTHRERLDAALADDLNMPRALSVLWSVLRASDLAAADKRALLHAADAVLGLREATRAQERDPRIDRLVAERLRARAAKDWARADGIRERLAAEGIELSDEGEASRWRRVHRRQSDGV